MLGHQPYQALPNLPVISTFSLNSLGLDIGQSIQNFTSAAYPSANRAIYIPFHIDEPLLASLLFCANGATASGNVDMGIYSASFVRLVSIGSTAQAGTNAIQTFDITDTLLAAGDYYFGIAVDNTTATLIQANPGVPMAQSSGLLMQASAFPLPATATPVTVSSGYTPLVGLRQGGTAI